MTASEKNPSIKDQRPGSLQIWLQAARPKTLWAAVAPVMMGSSMAYAAGGFHAGAAGAALACALLIQIGTNFCNDYADFKKGADTADRIGPVRATQAGWVTPAHMRRATVLTFALAAGVWLYLVYRGGWPMLVIGIVSIAAGVLYTAGPYALAYLGLGDLFVLIFFGPVAVGGTYFAQTGTLSSSVLWAGLAPGCLSCAILVVNNLRDIQQDRAAGKRTLAVRFGPRFARAEYLVTVFVPLVVVPTILWRGHNQSPLIGLVALSGMIGIRPIFAIIQGQSGITLNPALGQTARMLLVYAMLFTFVHYSATLSL